MSKVLGGRLAQRRCEEHDLARLRKRRSVRHITLAFPMESAHVQELVRGVVDFSAEDGDMPWRFTTLAQPLAQSVPVLSGWQGDGVIAALHTSLDVRAAAALLDLGLPFVNISSGADSGGGRGANDAAIPGAVIDNAAVGRLAAEHFLARGFRQFAYVGIGGVGYSAERGRSFVQRLRKDGFECAMHTPTHATANVGHGHGEDTMAVASALGNSDRPVGVFAANDRTARAVIRACLARGLQVPEQASVLGVDNDRPTCEASDLPLSSVACDWWRVGYEAAKLLDSRMDGHTHANGGAAHVLVQPLGIVARRSTETMLIDSVSVTRAVAYVRQNLPEVFGVEALIRASGVPRRSLELAFKRAMGCTPYRFVIHARLSRAKELLSSKPRRPLSEVARACGFADLRRFRLVFRREFGISPAEHREAFFAAR